MNALKRGPTVLMLSSVFALLVAVGDAQAAKDPRKCEGASARACASSAAEVAVTRRVGGVNNMRCANTSKTFLVWSCSFLDTVGNTSPDDTGDWIVRKGKATVTFRAFSSGWHTAVAVNWGPKYTTP